MKNSIASLENRVYVLRKTGITLTELLNMEWPDFYELLNELYYQESVDKYEYYSILNTILSEIHNAPICKPKILKPKDYYQVELPLRFGEKLKKKKSKAEDMLKQVQILNASLGGNVVEKE